MGEIVYKQQQIVNIAKELNIPICLVDEIFNKYRAYLQEKLTNGYSVKFLNICYLKKSDALGQMSETLAYVASEIGHKCGVSGNIVFRVLTTYEEIIIKELKKSSDFIVRGLVRIRLEEFYSKKSGKTELKLRLKKSTIYNSENVRVSAVSSFKRKLEVD